MDAERTPREIATEISASMMIEARLALREKRSERKKIFDAADNADKDAENVLETELLRIMNERGEEQIKTRAGTAYKSPQMRVTMTDREELIAFVKETGNFDLFTNHVNKEAVKALLEQKVQPPGVDIQTFVQCNIRKA